MDQTINKLTLDVSKNSMNINEPIKLRQGDKNSHTISAKIVNHGQDYPLNELTVELYTTKPDGVVYTKLGQVNGNTVTCQPDEQLTTTSGKMNAFFKIKNSDGNVIDSTNDFLIEVAKTPDVRTVSLPYIESVEKLIEFLKNNVNSEVKDGREQINQLELDFNKFKSDYQAVLNNNKNLDLSRFAKQSDLESAIARITNLEQAGFVRYAYFNDNTEAAKWAAENHGIAVTPN